MTTNKPPLSMYDSIIELFTALVKDPSKETFSPVSDALVSAALASMLVSAKVPDDLKFLKGIVLYVAMTAQALGNKEMKAEDVAWAAFLAGMTHANQIAEREPPKVNRRLKHAVRMKRLVEIPPAEASDGKGT